jgi:hypothetical protein
LKYIKNYQTVYRKVVKEAKRMELEKLVASAINKPKRMWNIINNEIENTTNLMDNIKKIRVRSTNKSSTYSRYI